MKTVWKAASLFLPLLLLTGPLAHASEWSGGNGTWDSDSSPGWNGTGIPNGQGAVASFTTGGSSTLTGTTTIGSFLYSGNQNASREIKLNSCLLILDQDGDGPGAVVISNDAVRASGRMSISSGSVELRDNLLLVNTGTSAGTYSIGLSCTLSGAGDVTTRNVETGYDTGSITITGANTFSGNVYIETGTVKVNRAPFGVNSNPVTLGIPGGGDVAIISTGSSTAIANPITVAENVGGTVLIGSSETGTASASFSGALTLGSDVSLLSEKTGTAGVLISGILSGPGGVRKVGAGPVFLTRENQYTGGTVVESGTLEARVAGALGSGSVSVTGSGILSLLAEGTIHPQTDVFLEDNETGSATLRIADAVSLPVQSLTINGRLLPRGLYGAPGSGAALEDAHFAGTGLLDVLTGLENATLFTLH